jgi:Protein of unknown function (DUF1236)
MRAAYHLAFAVFSIGTVATPTTAPNATGETGTSPPASQQHALLDAVGSIAAEFSVKPHLEREVSLATSFNGRTSIGETIPETMELHPIPRHETYRYAVVNDRRVIVDAASRKIVYVIQ